MKSDSRFDFKKDPRFKRLASDKRKLAVDSRFKSIFDGEGGSSLDPYGRPKTASVSEKKDMKRMYQLDKSVKTKKSKKEVTEDDKPGAAVSDSPSADDESTTENEEFAWHAESDSSDSDEDQEIETEETGPSIWDSYDGTVPLGDESKRLAIIGCDWDALTAKDLLVVLNSFLQTSGKLLRVAVYLSDFGKERLAHESVHGPVLNLPKINVDEADKEEEENDPQVMHALRQYQKERSKYYYAVVECDSIETASHLYNELEGVDTEFSVDGLDIRFIPHSAPAFTDTFPRAPESTATELQLAGYHAPAAFQSALRHSSVRCTWDETPASRTKRLRKRFSAVELAELDLKDYMVSSDGGSDGGEAVTLSDVELPSFYSSEQNKQSVEVPKDDVTAYRQMLLGDSDSDAPKKTRQKKVEDVEFEFHMSEGRESEDDENSNVKEKNQELAPWDEFLQKKQEKRRRRKEESKKRKLDVEDTPVEDRKTKKSMFPLIPSAKHVNPNAELELLALDRKRLPTPKEATEETEAPRRKKKSKKTKLDDDRVGASDHQATINFSDERFKAILTNPNFAVDPTNPSFHKSRAYEGLLQQTATRKSRR